MRSGENDRSMEERSRRRIDRLSLPILEDRDPLEIRAGVFRAAILVTIAVLVLFTPLILVALGWFLEPYQASGGVDEVSHRVHEVTFGIIFALALVGALSQRRHPTENIAGMQQLVVVIVVFTVVVAVSADRFEWLVVLLLLPVVVAALFHPSGRRLLWPPPRVSAPLLLLALVGLMPLGFGAARQLRLADLAARDHTTHWSAMAAFFIILIALALLVASRPPGYRLGAYSIGGAAILYTVASLVFPFDASAHEDWLIFPIIWGAAWLAVGRWHERIARRLRGPEDEEDSRRAPGWWLGIIAGGTLIGLLVGGPVIVLIGGVALGVLLWRFYRRRQLGKALVAAGGFLVASMVGLMFAFLWMIPLTAPNIPHSLADVPGVGDVALEDADRGTCLLCHLTEVDGAPRTPHANEVCSPSSECIEGWSDCRGCHAFDPELRTMSALPGHMTAARQAAGITAPEAVSLLTDSQLADLLAGDAP